MNQRVQMTIATANIRELNARSRRSNFTGIIPQGKAGSNMSRSAMLVKPVIINISCCAVTKWREFSVTDHHEACLRANQGSRHSRNQPQRRVKLLAGRLFTVPCL